CIPLPRLLPAWTRDSAERPPSPPAQVAARNSVLSSSELPVEGRSSPNRMAEEAPLMNSSEQVALPLTVPEDLPVNPMEAEQLPAAAKHSNNSPLAKTLPT